MNQVKTERKGKKPHTEKDRMHVPSGWCVRRTLAYGDIIHPVKMYHGNDGMEKFIEDIKDETRQLYETFPEQSMIELTDMLKK